jgi:hypothetical protein
MALYQYLTPDYQEKVLARWEPVLGTGKDIESEQIKMATALVLENTQREFDQQRMMKESYSGSGTAFAQTGAFGAAPDGTAPGGFGAYTPDTYGGTADARMPMIVIPTARRIFPELLAHQVVGVQPMNGPVGFAFALRARYGLNGKGNSGVANGTEIGYNQIDSAFTGASGNSTGTSLSAVVDFWQSFAGTGSATEFGVNTYNQDGKGAGLTNSEWWNVGEDMPMARFTMEKAIVEAKSRKLASHWSLELAEDMMNMHGIDVDSEMVNIMSYEVQAEIDRQLLTEMVKAALDIPHIGTSDWAPRMSTWSPVSADGRHQLERIGTLYTQILDRANFVAITSRRGPANFAICAPRICAIIERLQDFVLDKAGNASVNSGLVGVSKVGTLRSGAITVYRDTFAMDNYALLGYKGPTPYDSGIIYCPYIPLQLMRAVGPDNFSPRIGVRTRYGVLNHLFGANNYYHFIRCIGLVSTAEAADGGRVFMY